MKAETLVSTCFGRYPHAQLQDIYKALYQMCMGAEHAVVDANSAEHYLARELAAVEAVHEPLLECLGRGHYRLHLRPAKFHAIAPAEILQAFLASSRIPGDMELLIKLVDELHHLDLKQYGFTEGEAASFASSLAEKGYPPVHHSPEFRAHYSPAYRLLHVSQIPSQWLEIK